MQRTLLWLIVFAAATACCAFAAPAIAQEASSAAAGEASSPDAWPDWFGEFTAIKFPRGPGGYFSVAALLLTLLPFWGWIATTDWIHRDAVTLKLNYRLWNSIAWGGFAAAFLLTWLLPWFFVSFVLMLAAWIGPAAAYVRMRNLRVPNNERVFTPDHVKFKVAGLLKPLGVNIKVQAKVDKTNVPVTLVARGGATQADDQKRMIAARQSPGHDMARSLLYKAMQNRSSALMLDFTAEAVAVRYMIDGVWLDGERQPRAVGDPALACLKLLTGLKPEERRIRQQGTFIAFDDSADRKITCKLTSQGTKTGERSLVQFEDPEVRKRRLPDLGMRQKVQEELQALLAAKQGLLVIGAPPGGGLTSLTTACLAAIDRYTRSVMAVEDAAVKDVQVENVQVVTYDSLEQETPMTKLPGVIRQFPDVLVVPDLVDAETAALCCEEATSEDRLVVTTVRAREAAEALIRPLLTKVPAKKYAVAVRGVVVQRLVRKLCDACKEAYPPPPQILQRLGIPADRVQAFYRAPTQPRPEPCSACGGIGYLGQIALFELLTVTDAVRQQLVKEPTVDAVRLAARKAGMKTFEDEGLLLVVKGVISVQELARVLKEAAAKE